MLILVAIYNTILSSPEHVKYLLTMELAVHAFEETRTARFLFFYFIFYEQQISTVIAKRMLTHLMMTLPGTRYTQATEPEQTRLPKKN